MLLGAALRYFSLESLSELFLKRTHLLLPAVGREESYPATETIGVCVALDCCAFVYLLSPTLHENCFTRDTLLCQTITMADPLENPTWVFLPAGDLPPATEVPNLLGAIVADFQHPTAEFRPRDITPLREKFSKVLKTESKDFDSTLQHATSDDVTMRLGEMLQAEYKVDLSDNDGLKSKFMVTWTIPQARDMFEAIRAEHEAEILDMVQQNPKRHRGAVYMVVGIKACLDPTASSEWSTSRLVAGEMGVPVNSVVAAATGLILPMDASAVIGAKHQTDGGQKVSQVVCGARIFAVQYRIIMSRRNWTAWMNKGPARHTEYGDFKTVPKGKGFFSGEDRVEAEDDNDDELDTEELEEPDPESLALGSLRYSDSLKSLDREADQSKRVVVSHLD